MSGPISSLTETLLRAARELHEAAREVDDAAAVVDSRDRDWRGSFIAELEWNGPDVRSHFFEALTSELRRILAEARGGRAFRHVESAENSDPTASWAEPAVRARGGWRRIHTALADLVRVETFAPTSEITDILIAEHLEELATRAERLAGRLESRLAVAVRAARILAAAKQHEEDEDGIFEPAPIDR